jgi:hypothetical protein
VDVLPVAVDASMAMGAATQACTDTDTLVVLGPFNKRKTELRTKYEAIDAYQYVFWGMKMISNSSKFSMRSHASDYHLPPVRWVPAMRGRRSARSVSAQGTWRVEQTRLLQQRILH